METSQSNLPSPVCVIAQDPAQRELVRSMLATVACDIVEFENAAAFLEEGPTAPLCIVADLRLADMGAIELLRRLRQQGRKTPFIVLTERAAVDTAVEAMRAGALDFVEHGLMQRPLQRHVNRLLIQRQATSTS